jgi:hypothetical protein
MLAEIQSTDGVHGGFRDGGPEEGEGAALRALNLTENSSGAIEVDLVALGCFPLGPRENS